MSNDPGAMSGFEIIIDRSRNRHFPAFELVPGADVRWAGTQVRGPRGLPVRLR